MTPMRTSGGRAWRPSPGGRGTTEPTMDDPAQNADPGGPRPDEKTALEAVELAQRAYQAAVNLQWDDVRTLNDQATATANAVEGKEGDIVRTLVGVLATMSESLAAQTRDADSDRYGPAGQMLEAARRRLDELRRRLPAETGTAEFAAVVSSVEMQTVWAARGVARAQGDQRQVLIRDTQMKELINRMPEAQRARQQSLLALHRFPEVMGRLQEGSAALAGMDLGRALRVIADVRQDMGATL